MRKGLEIMDDNTRSTKDKDLIIDEAGADTVRQKQFYTALEKIKSGKVLQTLLALWSYSNRQGSFIFSGVRLSKIMETVLKKPKSGAYSQTEKRAFTEAVHRLRDFEIYLDQEITDTDDKGKRKKVIKRDFYRLIDLVGATYAKRKKDVLDPDTGEVTVAKGTADESVVIKLYGELLPKFNKGIMRGRLFGYEMRCCSPGPVSKLKRKKLIELIVKEIERILKD